MTHNLSLAGATVLVTRAPSQAAPFVHQVELAGGEAVQIPLINFREAANQKLIKQTIAELASFQWVIFTSVNGVSFFLDKLSKAELNQLSNSVKVATVGLKTAAHLRTYGLSSDVMPKTFDAESLAREIILKAKSGDKVLLVRGNLARPVLATMLRGGSLEVQDIPVYETFYPADAETRLKDLHQQKKKIDFITFTSSSTVRHFATIQRKSQASGTSFFPKAHIVCIGDITAREARKHQLPVTAVPKQYTIEAMVEELVRIRRSEFT